MSWYTLPTEMKAAIAQYLEAAADIKSFSQVDQQAYAISVPALFKNVQLPTCESLAQFLSVVPDDNCKHIRSLDITTSSTGSSQTVMKDLASLLQKSKCLQDLVLRLHSSLEADIIPTFALLSNLRNMTIINGSPALSLSERVIVAISASIPSLQSLEIDHVSRSLMHASDMLGVYPSVPLALGDENIPCHARLGSELSLPSLLRIPTLRRLSIRDTHLSDPRWATVPVACKLQVVDLGSCSAETDDANRIFQERIMTAVGRTVDEFTLNAPVSDDIFTKQSATPMKQLRKLHISSFFPVESIADTLTTLAGSPIQTLSVQCYDDDTADVCAAVEEFLSVRVERGPQFYQQLERIDISVITEQEDSITTVDASTQSRIDAIQHLQEYCRDLQLSSFDSSVCGTSAKKATTTASFTRPTEIALV